jgi:hypothetical protein
MPTPTGNAGFDTAAFQAEQQYQQALAVALAAYTNSGTGTSYSHDPLIISSFPVRFARFGRRPAVDFVPQGPVMRQFTAAVNDAYAAALTAAGIACRLLFRRARPMGSRPLTLRRDSPA